MKTAINCCNKLKNTEKSNFNQNDSYKNTFSFRKDEKKPKSVFNVEFENQKDYNSVRKSPNLSQNKKKFIFDSKFTDWKSSKEDILGITSRYQKLNFLKNRDEISLTLRKPTLQKAGKFSQKDDISMNLHEIRYRLSPKELDWLSDKGWTG